MLLYSLFFLAWLLGVGFGTCPRNREMITRFLLLAFVLILLFLTIGD